MRIRSKPRIVLSAFILSLAGTIQAWPSDTAAGTAPADYGSLGADWPDTPLTAHGQEDGLLCRDGDTGLALFLAHAEMRPDNKKTGNGTAFLRRQIPLVLLTGGPGTAAEASLAYQRRLADHLNRPVFLAAPSGTWGPLAKRLSCKGDAAPGDEPAREETAGPANIASGAIVESCLMMIRQQGLTRQLQDTRTIARTLARLRQTLNIERWHVMGESYGARPALALAALDTSGTASLVLDSPETPHVPLYWQTAVNIDGAFERLNALCRRDRACPARRRDFTKMVNTIVSRLDRSQPTENADAAQPTDAIPPGIGDAASVLADIALALRHRSSIAQLPYTLVEWLQADAPGFRPSTAGIQDGRPDRQRDRALVTGLYHWVRCRELPMERWYGEAGTGPARVSYLAPLITSLTAWQRRACEALGITPPDAAMAIAPVGVPILVLTGGLDPVTPAAAVTQAFRDWPETHIRLFETGGHVLARQHACILREIGAFLNGARAARALAHCSRRDMAIDYYRRVHVR